MADLTKWLEAGERMGLSGAELQAFVYEREKQFFEREERALRREKDQYEMKLKLQEQEALLKREADEREMLILKFKLEAEGQHKDTKMKAPRPKLAPFHEENDDIDAFLERFERYAKVQEWPEDTWSTTLSPLLTGKALDIYTGLPSELANEYPSLKTALLKRYQMTENGFRTKFRESKPGRLEPVSQFIARLTRYFKRWVQLAGVEHDTELLKDLLIREQFIESCTPEMALFLKERNPKSVEEATRIAEQYVEAHASGTRDKYRFINTTWRGPASNTTQGTAQHPEIRDSPRSRACYACGRDGHLARDCNEQPNNAVSMYNRRQGPRVTEWKERPSNEQQRAATASTKPPGSTAAFCQTLSQVNPVSDGYVSTQAIKVLRDTGCSTAVVKSDLVRPEQMTGKESLCVLIDGTIRNFPIASIFVDTPFFVGTIDAMCVNDPIYELIIGNLPGASTTPNGNWKDREPNTEAAAVTTRAQTQRDKQPIKPLKTPTEKVEAVNHEELKKAQHDDPELQSLFVKAREKAVLTTKGQNKYRMAIEDDLLYRVYEQPNGSSNDEVKQIVVPCRFRQQIITLAHESIVGGHLGSKKTLDRITSSFHWPGVSRDVTKFCASCDICQKTVPRGSVTKVPLGRMPVMEEPFQRVAVDLIGPISPVSDKGNRYILTVVDYATRYPEAVALPKIETERVAEALLEVFCRVGFPKEILSDRGTQFTSSLMGEVCRLVSVKQLFTTPYNPKCNGLCDRINGVIKNMLKKTCQERPRDWDRYLPAVLFAYREVPQASTGFSPFELLYGRVVRGPMQILKELWTGHDNTEVKNSYQYVIDLKNRLQETCRIARENLLEAQGRYKHHYDKKARPRKFKAGDMVIVLLPTDHNKLLLQWKGPYEVMEVLNDVDYKIRMGNKVKTFHANLLKVHIRVLGFF